MPPARAEFDSPTPAGPPAPSPAEQGPVTMVALVDTPHAAGRMPALRHFDEYLVPAAALAHLAVEARGSWRVRRGFAGWEQAGPDGTWAPVEIFVIGEVAWFRLAPGWRLHGPADDFPEHHPLTDTGTEGGHQVSMIPRQRMTAKATLAIVPPARRPA